MKTVNGFAKVWIVAGLALIIGGGAAGFWFFSKNSKALYTVDGKAVPPEIQKKIEEMQKELQSGSANQVPADVKTIPAPKGPEEAKSFRQAISDMAWGRKRAAAPSDSPSVKALLETPQLPENEQIQMIESRMEYCAKNKGKDPSCP